MSVRSKRLAVLAWSGFVTAACSRKSAPAVGAGDMDPAIASSDLDPRSAMAITRSDEPSEWSDGQLEAGGYAAVPMAGAGTVTVVSVQGGLDAVQVTELLKQQADGWSRCAEQGAEADNAHPLQLLIGPDGSVVRARWLDGSGTPGSAAACIAAAVSAWKWPGASGPSRVSLKWSPRPSTGETRGH